MLISILRLSSVTRNLKLPLSMYPEKTKTLIQKDTHIPMSIAALFTIAKTWKQPKCPLTKERIKMWHTQTDNAILLSHEKE